MATNNYWGYHLMLDCSGCNPFVKDPEAIKEFNDTLVKIGRAHV